MPYESIMFTLLSNLPCIYLNLLSKILVSGNISSSVLGTR